MPATSSIDVPRVVAEADERVVLLTRRGCHLCEQAEATLAASGAAARVLDVDSDDDLRARFTDHVPVTFVDGVLLSYWVLDPDRLRAALVDAGALPEGEAP